MTAGEGHCEAAARRPKQSRLLKPGPKMPRSFYVYILTNTRKTVLYVGVTNNLARRVATHRARLNRRSFTARYNVTRLVYWEQFGDPLNAIRREKQLKAGSRAKKVALIDEANPGWRDLGPEIGLL